MRPPVSITRRHGPAAPLRELDIPPGARLSRCRVPYCLRTEARAAFQSSNPITCASIRMVTSTVPLMPCVANTCRADSIPPSLHRHSPRRAPPLPRGWMLATHPYIGKPHNLPIFKNFPFPPSGFQGLNFKIQPLVHPERLFAANGHFARFSILDAKTGTIRWEWYPFLGISTQKPSHRTAAGARTAKNR